MRRTFSISRPIKVAVAGLGAVGFPVARALESGAIKGMTLASVSARDHDAAFSKMANAFSHPPPPILPLEELADSADVVVEAAPPSEFGVIAGSAVARGRTLVALSATQLLSHCYIIDEADRTGARIIVPTGALLGLDAVRAACRPEVAHQFPASANEGGADVVMSTRKPPAGLQNAPFVREQGLDLLALDAPLRLFQGSVREAAGLFPANVNVAVALSLAGVGPDKTMYEVWADPGVSRNTHRIEVQSPATSFSMEIAGVPSRENPATGMLTPLSVIDALEGMVSPFRVGS
jgi:aspartate dehydrogenase